MRTLPILLIATCTATANTVAQSVPLQPAQQYSAGTRLASAAPGVSFTIPDQYVGAYDGEAGVFLMVSQSNPGTTVGVWAFSDGTLEEIIPAVGEHLGEMGIQLFEARPPTMTAQEFSGLYTAMTEQGMGVLAASARRGTPGNSIVVAVLGGGGNESQLQQLATQIAQSGQFTDPQARTWAAQIGGTAFVAGSAADQYSPGGVGAGSFVSKTDARLDLCSGGEYGYQMQSESYVSVEGAGSMSSNDSDQHSGRWRLIGTIGGEALLVLDAMDGRSFLWSAEEVAQGRYVIDGTNYIAAPSQACR